MIGVVGLLLPMAAGPRAARSLSPWLSPGGHGTLRVDEIRMAAAAADARVEEDDKYFDPSAPEAVKTIYE